MKIVGIGTVFALVGAAMMTAPCLGGEAKYKIKGGDLVVESPFDLEIGSPEYAKALGYHVHS